MRILDWNRERWRTRDRLLEYDTNLVPPHPLAAGGIPILIYPWENTSLNILFNQLYALAIQNGFLGTIDEFKQLFSNYVERKQILFADYKDFPVVGDPDKFYFDQVEKILYHWEDRYIPVNAMLIANTVLDGGEA